MRRNLWTLCWAMVFAAVCAAAQSDSFLGAWTGTWDGAGSSGGFDITLERVKDGPLAAKVAVTGEPSYEATLSQVSFDGKKMTGKYDFPPQPGAEILLVATFEGKTATGTWSLHDKASGTEVVSGNWKVSKK